MAKSIVEECKNCSNTYEGKYCNQCGQKADLKRFEMTNLHNEFLHGFFHVHHGFIFTIKELFFRPGITIRNYIAGKREAYFNPFTYMVLISILGGFIFSHSGMIEHARENLIASAETLKFTREHLSYRVLSIIPIYAILCFFLFRSSKYNLAEHLIISTFVVSQSIIFFSVWFIYADFVSLNEIAFRVLRISAILSLVIYQVIALARIFNSGNFALRCTKATLAVLAGIALSSLLMNFLTNLLKLG